MVLIGFASMLLVQGATLPQIYKLWKHKEARGISLPFFIMIWLGLLGYLIYAIHINDLIYIVSNAVGLLFKTVAIVQVIIYNKRLKT